MSKILSILHKMQELREPVPTYALFAGIRPDTLLKVRVDLEGFDIVEEVDVVLYSNGGSAGDAYRMIRTFRERFKIVNIIVPFWAKSAATLFAFGASRMVLHEFGELGPIDAQIKQDREDDPGEAWVSALNVHSSLEQIEKRSREGMVEAFTKLRDESGIKIGRRQLADMLLDYSAKFYAPLLQKIETIELGAMSRNLNIGKMYAMRILKQYTDINDLVAEKFLDFLVYECPDHGYVIDYYLLKTYLSHVIRADEEPFGSDYYSQLGKLSIATMEPGWKESVGFIDNLINNLNEKNVSEKKYKEKRDGRSVGESGGFGVGSSEDDGAESISGERPPRRKIRVVP